LYGLYISNHDILRDKKVPYFAIRDSLTNLERITLMKTITLMEPGSFVLSETEAPQRPAFGEALIRVRRIGICGTDLHAYRGRQPFFTYPRILGHELGVEVLSVGDGVSEIHPGDCCAVEPYLNCGSCVACRRGKTNCCDTLEVLGVHTDGGMREQIVVPASKLHKSEKLTLDQLALVETLGIGAHAVDRASIEPGENVQVIGAGPIGLSVIQFAAVAGARLIVMDTNERRLEFCRQRAGVIGTLQPGDGVLERLRSLCGGELPTVVFDVTGNPQSMMESFLLPANSGKLVFVGLTQAELTFKDSEMHRRELTLLRSRNSTAKDFARIIRLIEGGEIDTTPWITHRSSIDQMIDVFPTWLEPSTGVIKAVVES